MIPWTWHVAMNLMISLMTCGIAFRVASSKNRKRTHEARAVVSPCNKKEDMRELTHRSAQPRERFRRAAP